MSRAGAVEVPAMDRTAPGEVEPIKPNSPPAVRWAKVVVAPDPVDEAIVKSGREPRSNAPATESRAQGEEVPMPNRLLVVSRARKLAESRVVAPE